MREIVYVVGALTCLAGGISLAACACVGMGWIVGWAVRKWRDKR